MKITANQSITVPGNKCWVYPSPVSLTAKSATTEAHLNQFFTKWESHGADVKTGFWHIAFDHFLIISVNEQQVQLSGCSMDSMRNSVVDLGNSLKVDFLNRLIYYVDAHGAIQSVDRPGFKERVLSNTLTLDTIVFDPTIVDPSLLKEGKLAVALKDCWHLQLYKSAQNLVKK